MTLKVVVVELVFYGSSTHFRSFRARSVNLATLILGKPHRQLCYVFKFTDTKPMKHKRSLFNYYCFLFLSLNGILFLLFSLATACLLNYCPSALLSRIRIKQSLEKENK